MPDLWNHLLMENPTPAIADMQSKARSLGATDSLIDALAFLRDHDTEGALEAVSNALVILGVSKSEQVRAVVNLQPFREREGVR